MATTENTWSDGDVATAALLNNLEDTVIVRCDSASRPTGAEGRVIFETDTNQLLIYDGSAWNTMWSDWISWTVSWASGLTVGNGTYDVARYKYISTDLVYLELCFLLGSTSAVTGDIQLTTPITMNDSRGATGLNVILSNAGTDYPGMANARNPTTTDIQAVSASGSYAVRAVCSATIPFGSTWTTGDRIVVYGLISL